VPYELEKKFFSQNIKLELIIKYKKRELRKPWKDKNI